MSTPKNIESSPHEEEFAQLRRQASEKDNQVALVQNELWKKNNEIRNLREEFNEALEKFRLETDRVRQLETELSRCNEDLRSERFARGNLEATLQVAREKLNSEEQSRKHLESELEDYASRTSSQHQHDTKRLLFEKQKLESKLKVAEAKLQEERLSHSSSKADSSSIHMSSSSEQQQIKELQDRLYTAQRELTEASRLLSIARKEAEKVNRLQDELITAHNARMQAENMIKSKVAEFDSVQEKLQDQEEELEYWRSTHEDQPRETDKIQEIIHQCDQVKKDLEDSKARERALRKKLEMMEVRETEIVMDKEEALNEVDRLKAICEDSGACSSNEEDLHQMLKEKDLALRKSREYANELQEIYKETLTACDAAEARVQELEKQIQSSAPDPPPLIVVSPPPSKNVSRKPFLAQPTHEITPQDEAAILRLLTAVDRLRSERDSLRRAVHFTSVEHRISLETVQSEVGEKAKEIAKLHVELETLRQQLDDATTEGTTELLKFKDEADVWRRKCETLEFERKDDFHTNEADLQIMQTHLTEVETSYQRSKSALKKSIRMGSAALVLVQHLSDQLKVLHHSAETNEQRRLQSALEKEEMLAAHEVQLADAMKEVEVRDSRISHLHSEIQDLNIQVSNLQYEMKEAKEELFSVQAGANSEHIDERDPAVLLSRINALEQRVLRRTEQIGILQHDSKRIETNLRLAEDTIMELTGDLDDMKRERACLVDDCAQARKDRDNALHRLDEMEVEVETLQNNRNNETVLKESLAQAQAEIADQTQTIESLIAIVFDLKARLRCLNSLHIDMTSQIEVHQDETRALEGQYAHSLAENERLTSRIDSMEVTLIQQTDDIDKWKQDLSSAQAEVDRLLKNLEECADQMTTYEAQISREKQQHLTALESLRAELAKAEESLTSSRQELETVQREEEELRQSLHALQENDSSNSAEVTRLNSIIRELQASLEEQTIAHNSELATLRQTSEDDRSRLQSEMEASGSTIVRLHEEYRAAIQGLEEKLVAGKSLVQAAEAVKDNCELQLERIRSEHAKEILVLKSSVEEERKIKISLEAELQGASDSVTELENHIAAAVSRYESEIRDLEASISETRSQVDGLIENNRSLQRDKTTWELDRARLEGALEQASTKCQYADQQLKNREHELHALEVDMQHLRAQIPKLEETARSAEAALVLRTSQFEQKLALAQRELEKGGNHRQCEETVSELREKIEYLEEVLQMKSAEIEENDDRFIEVLKDKKRLQGKIDSLDRKYRGLQTKSQTLTTKNEDLLRENEELLAKLHELGHKTNLRRKADEPTIIPEAGFPIEPEPRPDIPRSKTPNPLSTGPSIRPPTRIPSSPAVVLRAKTPDRGQKSVPDLPVIPPFMAQQTRPNLTASQTVPNLQSPPNSNTPPSIGPSALDLPSSSGRKRRLPDDFDSPLRIPVQAIVTSLENSPPRRSRGPMVNDAKGFTPTRRTHHIPSSPLPQKGIVPLGEATNSPRDARSLGLGKPSLTSHVVPVGMTKGSTKSWLSKSRMLLGKDGRSVTTHGTR